MKLKQELREQFLSQKRREEFDRFQVQKKQIREMLSHINSSQIRGQMDQIKKSKKDQLISKINEKIPI